MRFSQRQGIKPVKSVWQVESIDDDLRNRLWNVIRDDYFKVLISHRDYGEDYAKESCREIWKEFFNLPIDEIPRYGSVTEVYVEGFIEYLKQWFFQANWYEIYDLIEFFAVLDSLLHVGFLKKCNSALEKEVSGYRIVSKNVVSITSQEEIEAIEGAIYNTDIWKSVSKHLQAGLDNLADKKVPNYRNSIKESISAVESLCKIIVNDDNATLGKALIEIEKSHKLHPALKKAYTSIYDTRVTVVELDTPY